MKPNDSESAQSKLAIEMGDLTEDYQEVARIIGLENAIELSRKMGGEQIHIPMLHRVLGGAKYRLILKEFNGFNFRALAHKYGYTERWIREVVKQNTLAGRGGRAKTGQSALNSFTVPLTPPRVRPK